MFDNANYGTIRNCKIYGIGMEGLHLRDGSSNNLVDGCTLINIGIDRPDMGEGVYVGSARGTNQFSYDCNYNTIENCTLGPNIGAEHFDIKEGTVGTVIRNNIMHGTGISGGNYADSFIDLKGNDAVVTGNIGYREGNKIIVDAVQLHNQVDDWGNNNEVSNNTFYLDDDTAYVINATGAPGATSATTCGNMRIPDGNMYKGNVTEREPDVKPELQIISLEGTEGGTVSGAGAYENGTTVTLVATPDEGYTFDGWYENGNKLDGVGETYSFTAVKDRTLKAVFKRIDVPELNITDIDVSGELSPGNRINFTVETTVNENLLDYALYICGNGKVYYENRNSNSNIFSYTPCAPGTYNVIAYCFDKNGNKASYMKQFTVK